jgi:hypothetical protein
VETTVAFTPASQGQVGTAPGRNQVNDRENALSLNFAEQQVEREPAGLWT